MAIKTEVMTVTPDVAREILENHNPRNRSVSQKKVEQYARDMQEGKWQLNGEAIIFDDEGNLLNGQHRLWGCIEAGFSFQTVVIRGIHPDSFVTMDTGKNRSTGDVLKIGGVDGAITRIAAAATVCLRYLNNTVHQRGRSVPKQDILKYASDNKLLAELVHKAIARRNVMSRHAALLGAVAFLASNTHEEAARDFLEKCITGEDIRGGHPCLALRNRLMQNTNEPTEIRFAMIVSAWNAFVENRQWSKVQLPRSLSSHSIIGAPAQQVEA